MQRGRIKLEYDEAMDPSTWKCWKPFGAKYQPKWKKQLRGEQLKVRIPRVSKERKAREQVEMQAEELIHRVADALEIMLHQLMDTRAPTQYDKRINQGQLYNVLWALKNKCGVEFEDDGFAHKRVDLDQPDPDRQPEDWHEQRQRVADERLQEYMARRDFAASETRQQVEHFKAWHKEKQKAKG